MKNQLFLCLALLGLQVIAQATPNTDLSQDLKQKLEALKQKYHLVGANLSVVLPDESVVQLSTGYANKAQQKKMTPKTKMLSGSIGKTYCMAIILQLAEEGKIGIEDKISKYFGKEDWFKRLPNAEDITVKMLLNHTGGLPRWVFELELWEKFKNEPNKVWTGAERLAYVLDKEPVHPAGNGWAYSDTDYILLGMIIEQVTGKEYYKNYKSRLAKPYKLKKTVPSNKRKISKLANGYSGANPYGIPNEVLTRKKYFTNPQFEWTGGGFASTATDLAKWAKFLYKNDVVTPELRKQMQQPVNRQTGKADKTGYGFANEMKSTFEGIVHGHSGFMPGFLSVMQYIPEYDFSIAFQMNADIFYEELKMKSLDYYIERFRGVVVNHLEKEKANDLTTIYLVRHAEKSKNHPKDPDLSPVGQERAKRLAKLLANVKFDAVYSTNYKRTQQTVTPLVENQKLEILPYNPSDLKGAYEQILKGHKGGNIFVAGHSNTTPTFVNTILNRSEYDWLDESEYDKLFIVTIDGNGNAKVNVLSY